MNKEQRDTQSKSPMIQKGETHISGIKLVPHILPKCMAQMEKQINVRKVTRFDIVRTEMLSVRHKPTALTFWKTNLLHCPHKIVWDGAGLTSKHL